MTDALEPLDFELEEPIGVSPPLPKKRQTLYPPFLFSSQFHINTVTLIKLANLFFLLL